MKDVLNKITEFVIGLLIFISFGIVVLCILPILIVISMGFMLWLSVIYIFWLIKDLINKFKNKTDEDA